MMENLAGIKLDKCRRGLVGVADKIIDLTIKPEKFSLKSKCERMSKRRKLTL